jgi:hypothetical protein
MLRQQVADAPIIAQRFAPTQSPRRLLRDLKQVCIDLLTPFHLTLTLKDHNIFLAHVSCWFAVGCGQFDQ